MFNILSLLALLSVGLVEASPMAPMAYGVSPLSTIAGVQGTNGDSRMFYQKADGSIWQTCISGSWKNGHTTCDSQVVPKAEALASTPLAAAASPDLNEWHLFFVSPTNTVSEYVYQQSSISATNPSGVRGGVSCSDCITAEQFAIVPTKNRVLWALWQIQNDKPKLRVWYVSPGQPNTVMEAGKERDETRWTGYALPDRAV